MTPEEVALLRQSAEGGGSAAQLMLGLAYRRGDGGLPKDAALAARWLEKAAVQGNAYAENELGDLYLEGAGVPKNPRLAADWWEKAAARGSVRAQFKLGKALMEGKDIPADREKGRQWLERAATEGSAEAQYLLGRMYHEGEWVPRDPAMAKSLLERSALQGYDSAISLLHMLEGIGYSLEAELHNWQPDMHKLAADGDPEAQYQLGLRLEHGVQMPKDIPAALDWYRRAAASGHRRAMLGLARIYEQGAIGVPADPAQAREWRAKAEVQR